MMERQKTMSDGNKTDITMQNPPKWIILILVVILLFCGVWLEWSKIREKNHQLRVPQISFALYTDDLKTVRLLLRKDTSLAFSYDEYGHPILSFATTVSGARLLLDAGADINATGSVGSTVLHYLAGVDRGSTEKNQQKIELARFFVSQGADPAKQDKYGATPLHYCGKYGDQPMARFFISCGVDVNAVDREGETPLHYAAWGGCPEVCELLIHNGADVNFQNYHGETPLHKTAINGNLTCLKILIQNRADLGVKDDYGKTPLDCAREVPGGEPVCQFLKNVSSHADEKLGGDEKQED